MNNDLDISGVRTSITFKRLAKISIAAVFIGQIASATAAQQCNWYGNIYPLCTTTQSGWGWENNKSCIAPETCSTAPSPYGIVNISSSSVASSAKLSSSSKAAVSSSKSSVSSSSLQPSSAKSSSSIAAACSGTAPSGILYAQRINGANTTRSGLYEGPVWTKGALYFSDFTWSAGNPSQIQRLDANGVMTTVIKDSGSNGLAVDAQGDLVAGTHKYKSLSRFNITTGARTSIVDHYNGNIFNSPNDVTIAKDGTIYFTDPDFQKDAAPGGQPKTRVYRVATNGAVSVIDETISEPNGISLSPKEDVLYVNGGTPAFVRAYPIVNGIPQAGKNIVTGLNSTDGMSIDCLGNIYVAEHSAQHIKVFTPAGKEIATINVDANVTNSAFGGAQGKTLFITGAGAVWKIDLNVTGSPY